MSIVSNLSSLFNPQAAPPSASDSPSSASNLLHADRAAARDATRRDVADRLAARRADRAREDLADLGAADAAVARAEREFAEGHARSASSISEYLHREGAQIVSRVRSVGTRAESEELRVLVCEVDARCRRELGEALRSQAITYLVSAERRPINVEQCLFDSTPGARGSFCLRAAAAGPVAFHDQVVELDRAIEGAPREPDLERFEALRACIVGSQETRISAAILKRRNGALA